jgi:Holliday junction resolvase RusA-like endonuclease
MNFARIKVYGLPAPKGSKSFKGMSKAGRAILVEDSAKTKPWMEACKWAVIEAGRPKIAGPVSVRIVFTMHKPKSAPKRRRTVPDRKPDLDKLQRSTWDALTQIGVIEDDARIVMCEAMKVFPGEHADAMDAPGAVIEVRAMEI